MATRGSYVHNSMVEFRGHPENVSFMQFSQKIDGFRQKDSGLLELVQLYKQNPLDKFFIFTMYQNYTLALSEWILAKWDQWWPFFQKAWFAAFL